MPLSLSSLYVFSKPISQNLSRTSFSGADFHTFLVPASDMGVSFSFSCFFFIFFFLNFSLIRPLFADINSSNSTLSPPPPSYSQERRDLSPFKPSIAVIVGVLTTMFSVTFLILLYAKHCKRGNGAVYNGHPNSRGAAPTTARKNSGIDRAVIESLPIFRFGSLRGQKDGLECAVCLARFETTEVLRLLPKCKHAFHVECVDTWLDAHSTCPLCRYRVEPEDILLIEDAKILHENQLIPIPPPPPPPPPQEDVSIDIESRKSPTHLESRTRDETSAPGFRRVLGRHSSAGERASGFLQLVLQRPGEMNRESGCSHDPTSLRRSLDSSGLRQKSESVAVGCFDRPRKDGLLLSEGMAADRTSFERSRFEHRIIISAGSSGFHHRWSDVQPSDLLYLRSEMIISDSHRFSSATGSRPSGRRHQYQSMQLPLHVNREEVGIDGSGRSVINSRSVSEITGLNRFSSRASNNSHRHRERQAGVVSRWLAWISSQSQPDVRSERTAIVV